MGVLMVEKSDPRRAPELSTEYVEKLWKSGHPAQRKLGESLRIWHFAQNLVKLPLAAGE
jgi:hypothetical protein